MLSRKQKKYIQKFIDGDLLPERKKYIKELLDRDPDAKLYYEGLLEVENTLKNDASVAESPDLENLILRDIQQIPQNDLPSQVKKHWTEYIWPSPQWGIGYALIFGILIGIFIFSPVLRNRNWKTVSDSDMAGSMTNISTAFNLPIYIAGINATITAGYVSQDFLRIEINVQSNDLAQIRLSFNKDQFSLWTLKAVDQNPECRILADYSSVEVINRGENVYLVLLKKLSSLEETIRIEVFSNDMRQYENNITIK
ncbi:MAG: hypothetical protein NT175_06350 [Bacteroidetes bacterium]|nr:hypothetical protein [Bacteroidota bacterium]